MKREDGPRRTGRLAKLSLRKLGAYAMEEELVEGIEIREDFVTIVQGDNRFVLPPSQASTFLIGMLRGRSWFVEEDPFAGPGDPPMEPPFPGDIDLRLSDTLDSLLNFTKEVGILESFEKNEAEATVRLDIAACSTTLSFTDALSYLIDCIQHEMRSLRGETD